VCLARHQARRRLDPPAAGQILRLALQGRPEMLQQARLGAGMAVCQALAPTLQGAPGETVQQDQSGLVLHRQQGGAFGCGGKIGGDEESLDRFHVGFSCSLF
jgi:hypothetical protein